MGLWSIYSRTLLGQGLGVGLKMAPQFVECNGWIAGSLHLLSLR